MTPRLHLDEHRDDVLLVLLALATLITFLVDLLGWFRDGFLFGR